MEAALRSFLALLILSSVAAAQAFSAATSSTSIQPDRALPMITTSSTNTSSGLPALPKGKSTVVGGAIRTLDPVRDELTLAVFGGKNMKVFFDERTKVFRDGQPISLDDLRMGDRVSLETMLDGSTVFVRSIHAMTVAPEGQCRGQVLRYDQASGVLWVRDSLSNQPIKLHMGNDVRIVRQGQETASTAELQQGALVTVDFLPDNRGGGMAHQVSLVANPGSMFVFAGTVAFLDRHSGALVVVDPRDQERYEVSFDSSAIPASRSIREGSDVVVNAYFDGKHYAAQTITVNSPGGK